MRLRLRPSYSSVMSTLAVFIALSGGAYAAAKLPANSVGSRQLKNNAVVKAKIKSNSIDSSKVAPDALTGADIKEASLAKVPSAALADSATHANAAAAIDKLTYKTAAGSAAPQTSGAATAACDPGQHVTGGGVRVDNPDLTVGVDSYPDAANGAWTAHVWDDAAPGGTTLTFTVYAICTTATTVG
jgi:hypothetical protein